MASLMDVDEEFDGWQDFEDAALRDGFLQGVVPTEIVDRGPAESNIDVTLIDSFLKRFHRENIFPGRGFSVSTSPSVDPLIPDVSSGMREADDPMTEDLGASASVDPPIPHASPDMRESEDPMADDLGSGATHPTIRSSPPRSAQRSSTRLTLSSRDRRRAYNIRSMEARASIAAIILSIKDDIKQLEGSPSLAMDDQQKVADRAVTYARTLQSVVQYHNDPVTRTASAVSQRFLRRLKTLLEARPKLFTERMKTYNTGDHVVNINLNSSIHIQACRSIYEAPASGTQPHHPDHLLHDHCRKDTGRSGSSDVRSDARHEHHPSQDIRRCNRRV